VTRDRSVVFSGYFGFLHQKTDRHDIAEILLKVSLNTITLTLVKEIIIGTTSSGISDQLR
jgi:hypothetical protein